MAAKDEKKAEEQPNAFGDSGSGPTSGVADRRREDMERKEAGAPKAEDRTAEGEQDPLDESPVKAAKGVDKKPKAETPRGSGINMMNTEGTNDGEPLTPAQRARIEGTVIDGANGANVTGAPATEPVQ